MSNNGAAATAGGIGLYRFGMTREEVTQVPDCGPYSKVAVTGGLECPNFLFEGREINISFLFRGQALHRIQLWCYEGTSEPEARAAVNLVLDYLDRTAGGAKSRMPGKSVTADLVMDL